MVIYSYDGKESKKKVSHTKQYEAAQQFQNS